MTLIYQGLLLIVLVFTVWNLFTEKKFWEQMNAALVIIPVLLRILMIK